MPVLVNDETGFAGAALLSAMEKIAVQALFAHGLPENTEISLTFCDDAAIRKLNHTWRNKDVPTDVLSFPLYVEGEKIEDTEEILLGDIVISTERAAVQAQDYGHSLERETLFLFTHGVLHLLGYDHENEADRLEMRACEEELLQMAGATRDGL